MQNRIFRPCLAAVHRIFIQTLQGFNMPADFLPQCADVIFFRIFLLIAGRMHNVLLGGTACLPPSTVCKGSTCRRFKLTHGSMTTCFGEWVPACYASPCLPLRPSVQVPLARPGSRLHSEALPEVGSRRRGDIQGGLEAHPAAAAVAHLALEHP
jgi:hypothetical protein